jgi:two-component system nitrogen regulation response regulator GlnG
VSFVLIVDDEPAVCWALEKYLTSRGHQASAVGSAEEALVRLGEGRPDLVLLDVRLPGMDGLTALEQMRHHADAPPVIVITAHGTMETAVEAMRRGAFDYLIKPLDLAVADQVVTRALRSLEPAIVASPPQGSGSSTLVGSSAPMQKLYKQIGTLASSAANVLLIGESGTGKELVARAIHCASARRHQPFEPLVCASLPETLLESELYGHEPGAFTGANARRIGRLERADGGTLLLDEVGEISLTAQVRLLRFLEEREVERLGGTQRIPVDVRLIAATNRPLREMVARGTFREDLYYRLQVVELELPPLRARLEDIPELTGAFLAHGLHTAGISRDALAALHRHYWPGNVRELRHAIEHAIAMARGQLIAPEHLPSYLSGPSRPRGDDLRALVREQVNAAIASGESAIYDRLLASWEEALISPVLEHTSGNQLRAAQLLGLSRGTLRKKLRALGLKDDGSDNESDS